MRQSVVANRNWRDIMLQRMRRFLCQDDGPTAVEYAVMLACILLMCFASIATFGTATGGFWGNNQVQIQNAFGSGGGSGPSQSAGGAS